MIWLAVTDSNPPPIAIQDHYLQGTQEAKRSWRYQMRWWTQSRLVGSKARIRDHLQIWRDSPIATLNVTVFSLDALRFLAEEVL